MTRSLWPETTEPGWTQAGLYRGVVDALAHDSADTGVIGVASPHRGDGRSGVAAGLAVALAQGTRRSVLLLDLDLERATQADHFGIDPHPGLDQTIDGPRPLQRVARQVGPGLWVVPAGSGGPQAALGLLQRVVETELLDLCRREYGCTVVDLPPLLDSPGVEAVATRMDAYVLAARYHATRVDALARSAALLSRSPIGCVLTGHASPTANWITRVGTRSGRV